MNPDFTPIALVENINSLCLKDLKEILPAIVTVYGAMRPDRVLMPWEKFTPYVMTHFICTYHKMPDICYMPSYQKNGIGGHTHPRIYQHLSKTIAQYDYKQFADPKFCEVFIKSYFAGIIAVHNRSVEELGVSIFHDSTDIPWWATQKIEQTNEET
jgi:hypothetical protein